jgi:hypothetical protein
MKPRLRVIACLLLCFLLGPTSGSIAALSPHNTWDGTWAGGFDKDNNIEIVIAGNEVIGVHRDGDYPEILSSAASPEGRMLCVWWVGGDGFLQRTGDNEATIWLRERDRPVRSFTVRLDK